MWKIVTENPLVSAIVAGLIVIVLIWLFRKLKARLDSRRIYTFMRESENTTGHTFRSTAVISSATSIPESRVAELCSNDRRIKRMSAKSNRGSLSLRIKSLLTLCLMSPAFAGFFVSLRLLPTAHAVGY